MIQIGDAVFVRLSHKKGKRRVCTLIDTEDFRRVVRSNWYPRPSAHGFYAEATSLKYLPAHHKRLHALILRADPGQIIDHISGDTLDNRRQNLRIVTRAENAKNARRQTFPGKTSRFKGVCWSRYDGRWSANITSDGAQHYIGLFGAEVDAALAYDEAALKLHGEFARTNEMMRLYDMSDPFVPDCSRGARRSRHMTKKPSKEPRHSFNSGYLSGQDRLDLRLEREIELFRVSGILPGHEMKFESREVIHSLRNHTRKKPPVICQI